MDFSDPKDFCAKHGTGQKPDGPIGTEISNRIKDNQLPCAVAFEIAGHLGVSPEYLGKTADLMNVRLTKCQLGLFGYSPAKKIVTPLMEIDPGLENAIHKAQSKGRLTCRAAWEIASRMNVAKLTVSGACEAKGIKIKQCQLGAF